MNITTKSLLKLTPQEYRKCYSLNYRNNGYMQEFLKEHRNNPDAHAIMLNEEELFLGWALLVPVRQVHHEWGVTSYTKKMSKYSLQFYVRKTERRKGYGKILMDEALKIDRRPFVWPHDFASGGFFANYSVTANKWERSYYMKKRKVAA